MFGDCENATIRVQGTDKLSCVYDAVLDETASQEQVYEQIEQSVEQVILGFNATVYAYGQTGTGKTYTLLYVFESDRLFACLIR